MGGKLPETPQDKASFLHNLQRQEEHKPRRGYHDALNKAKTASVDTTARIFLDLGVWDAYFLLKNSTDSQVHFTGKADRKLFLNDLEGEPVPVKQQIATLLGSMLRDIRTGAKRSCNGLLEADSALPAPPPMTSLDIENGAPVLQNNNSTLEALDHRLVEGNDGSTKDDSAKDDQIKANASIQGTRELFPSQLSNAIRRMRHPENPDILVAAIWMAFPKPPVSVTIPCTMSLEVTTEKIEYLALEMFQIRIEVKDGLRYLYIGGAKVLPNPQMSLQGCRPEVISSIFGDEVGQAIAANTKYYDEQKAGRDRTDCVTMMISHQAHDGAVISFSLPKWEGTELKKKLYG